MQRARAYLHNALRLPSVNGIAPCGPQFGRRFAAVTQRSLQKFALVNVAGKVGGLVIRVHNRHFRDLRGTHC